MSADDIVITTVQKLELQPGDVLLVSLPEDSSSTTWQTAWKAFTNALTEAGHEDVPILLKPASCTVEIITAAQAAALTN